MRKVINGRMYDTQKAQEMGYWDNGYMPRDFNYCCETLYRKKTGEYFLHGEGGPLSRYAISLENMRSSGEQITPMTCEAAMEWAEHKLDGDSYEEIFGTVEEETEGCQTMAAKEMRNLLGVSRAEFSRRYGIPIRTLENWEAETEGNKRSAPEWAMRLLERAVREDAMEQMMNNVMAYINSLRARYGDLIATDPTVEGDTISFTVQPEDETQGTMFEVLADGSVRTKGIAPGCVWTEWREKGFLMSDDEVDELELEMEGPGV